MKTKVFLVLVISFMIMVPGFSQEKTKKELKEEKKLEHQKQTEAIVNSREFIFSASRAMPQGGRAIDLTTNPGSVKFSPDRITSDMPFFGSATGPIAYGGRDSGMKFDGKPDEYTVTKKKSYYLIKASVRGEDDTYHISLSVSFDETVSMIISSNYRSTMTYSGTISALEKADK